MRIACRPFCGSRPPIATITSPSLQPERRVLRRTRDEHALVGAEIASEAGRQRDELGIAPFVQQPVQIAVERHSPSSAALRAARGIAEHHSGAGEENRVERPRFDREFHWLAVTPQFEFDFFAGLDGLHCLHEFAPRGHGLGLDRNDDVARLDAASAAGPPGSRHRRARHRHSARVPPRLTPSIARRGFGRKCSNCRNAPGPAASPPSSATSRAASSSLRCASARRLSSAAWSSVSRHCGRCGPGERRHYKHRDHQPFHRVLHRISRCRPRPRNGPGPANA